MNILNPSKLLMIGLLTTAFPLAGLMNAGDSGVASADTAGPWNGAEVRSKASYGDNGTTMRARWRAKPAKGNCNVTLFSLFNGDRLFNTHSGHWSEIGFEIYGGSAEKPSAAALQTQYVTYENAGDAPTARGRQHAQQHSVGGKLVNIWDGRFHIFDLIWKPGTPGKSYISYRIDGFEIRRASNPDILRIEKQLEAYAGVWITKKYSYFGCSGDADRLKASAIVIDDFRIDNWTSTGWKNVTRNRFDRSAELDSSFDRSNWSFETFDGAYCPANVNVMGDSTLRLDINTKPCGQ